MKNKLLGWAEYNTFPLLSCILILSRISDLNESLRCKSYAFLPTISSNRNPNNFSIDWFMYCMSWLGPVMITPSLQESSAVNKAWDAFNLHWNAISLCCNWTSSFRQTPKLQDSMSHWNEKRLSEFVSFEI